MATVKRSTTKKGAAKKPAARANPSTATTGATTRARKAAATPALRTAAGTRVTRAYDARLAAEAEAGFDAGDLVARPVGRPSLTGRAGKSRRIDLRVDDETFAAVHELAEREDRPVSDIVRDALRHYVDAR
jgi:hypothetical protein